MTRCGFLDVVRAEPAVLLPYLDLCLVVGLTLELDDRIARPRFVGEEAAYHIREQILGPAGTARRNDHLEFAGGAGLHPRVERGVRLVGGLDPLHELDLRDLLLLDRFPENGQQHEWPDHKRKVREVRPELLPEMIVEKRLRAAAVVLVKHQPAQALGGCRGEQATALDDLPVLYLLVILFLPLTVPYYSFYAFLSVFKGGQ